jgi:hypothetical protein
MRERNGLTGTRRFSSRQQGLPPYERFSHRFPAAKPDPPGTPYLAFRSLQPNSRPLLAAPPGPTLHPVLCRDIRFGCRTESSTHDKRLSSRTELRRACHAVVTSLNPRHPFLPSPKVLRAWRGEGEPPRVRRRHARPRCGADLRKRGSGLTVRPAPWEGCPITTARRSKRSAAVSTGRTTGLARGLAPSAPPLHRPPPAQHPLHHSTPPLDKRVTGQ